MAAFENENNKRNQSKGQQNSDLTSCCLIKTKSQLNNELFLKSDFYRKKNSVIYDRITGTTN